VQGKKALVAVTEYLHMKAIVLAGGYATRLWPITKHRPKMFLPIGDTTVIDRIFADLEDDDRISEVYVSTNQRFAESFREHLEESRFEKPTLTIEETTAEDEKFGVVGALAQLVDREEIEEDTVVIAGDNLISFDVSEFVDFFKSKSAPTLAAYDVGSKEKAKSYGLVDLEGDEVVDFQEKPDDPPSTLVSVACYGFPADALSLLSEYLDSGNNPDEPGWFVQWLQKRQSVYAFTFEEAWFDIGTPESYLEAVAWYLDGDTYVAEGAEIDNSRLGENVHIMEDAEVFDSDVTESIVFSDATLRDCDIRSSIIDRDTDLDGLNLQGALIGAHTQISNDG
jgi:glucose-1-phosphate thymidylyltransferase